MGETLLTNGWTRAASVDLLEEIKKAKFIMVQVSHDLSREKPVFVQIGKKEIKTAVRSRRIDGECYQYQWNKDTITIIANQIRW